MKIQKNSRQVPKAQEIVSQKLYSDILYGYLQVNSSRDENGIRYIEKKLINFSSLEKLLNISRQTLSKRFSKLIEMGLVVLIEGSKPIKYELPVLQSKDGFLIPEETLRIMTNTLNDNTINVYVYLINRFIANKEQPFDFTITTLKSYCGLGILGDSNNYIISDILTVLQKLGLIEYTITKNKEGNSIKTHHHLIKANLICG